jgi:endoribonuclease Dicer
MADVCEAIIGAALLCGQNQLQQHDNAVKAVTVMVDSSDHLMTKWADYYACYKLPVYQTAPANQSQLDLTAQLEAKHPYHFRYPRLLRSAFTHPSYPFSWEKIPCYQRLEFLGDALLDMACVNFLFHRFPDRDPQWLTEHKVCGEQTSKGAKALKRGRPFPAREGQTLGSSLLTLEDARICVFRWQWCPISSWARSLCV